MKILSSTLVADGSSDRALIPLIMRAMQGFAPDFSFSEIASVCRAGANLKESAMEAIKEYPCDLLFVHRDAENQNPDTRLAEIADAVKGVCVRFIAVVPVKMTESWLIVDELAIRRAVGNPGGEVDLALPSIRRIEQINAKEVLDKALTDAAIKGARRRDKFRPERYRYSVAEQLPNLSDLRKLPSYAAFEERLRQAIGVFAKD